jgi:hypothetical protein
VSGEREAVAAALAEVERRLREVFGRVCSEPCPHVGCQAQHITADVAPSPRRPPPTMRRRRASPKLERDLAAARSALAAVREVRSSAAAARAVADRDAARIAGQVRASGEGREG